MYYIYKFQNRINKKVYIGSTFNIKIRYGQHKSSARNGSNCRFHKAIRKYGFNNFEFEVISTVFKESDVDSIEQWFIDKFNSIDDNYGYNMIGVVTGQREFISNMMVNEWKKEGSRKLRIKRMKEESKVREKSIIAVSIYDGSYTVYDCIRDAGRDGYSYSCIYPSLQDPTKTGQRNVWFYYNSNPEQYIQKAKDILGGFKNDYYKPIIATNKLTGEVLHFSSTFTLKDKGFKPKAVRRVLRGEREGYAGYYWKYA